jgi:nucleoside-diphosphate-sugar epimerase
MEREYSALIRARKFPLIGAGSGIGSFLHIDDSAAATAIAVERGAPGIYNVVDNQPAEPPSGCPTSRCASAPSRLAGSHPGWPVTPSVGSGSP